MLGPMGITSAQLEPAVAGALERFFGPNVRFELEPIAAGHSARSVYRLTAEGRRYVLRLSNSRMTPQQWADEIAYAKAAATAGVAPALRLSCAALGLLLMDWMEPTLAADPMSALAASLATLHRCNVDRRGYDLIEWLDVHHRDVWSHVRSGPMREALSKWTALRALCLQSPVPSAPCHQELNPGNVLFSNNRAWLIDWESAGTGDPLYDVASAANWWLWEGAQLERFLRGYLGRNASARELEHTATLKVVHFFFTLLVNVRDAGCQQHPDGHVLTWGEYLVQPGLASRWHQLPTVAQRQATLVHEIMRWSSCPGGYRASTTIYHGRYVDE
jgi:thiamine kinase-like enzyme